MEKNKEILEIKLAEGELYTGNLSDGDKFHLLTQYLNNQGAMIRGLLQINAQLLQGLRIICKKQGIDWDKEIAILSKERYEKLEKEIKQQKSEIEKASKKIDA